VKMRQKYKLSPVHRTHQGSVGGHQQVHLLVQHWKKNVLKSVDCDKTTWDCYDGRLIASFSTYIIYCYTEIDFL
jgi:hypothetical protein